jgi:hypothetical protein
LSSLVRFFRQFKAIAAVLGSGFFLATRNIVQRGSYAEQISGASVGPKGRALREGDEKVVTETWMPVFHAKSSRLGFVDNTGGFRRDWVFNAGTQPPFSPSRSRWPTPRSAPQSRKKR